MIHITGIYYYEYFSKFTYERKSFNNVIYYTPVLFSFIETKNKL